MRVRQPIVFTNGKQRAFLWAALCAAFLCAIILLAASLRHSRAVVEIVTTDINHQTPPAQKNLSVNPAPLLPPRDVDLETAGDRIAAATIYLDRRQKAAALKALAEARTAARHAADKRAQRRDVSNKQLIAALKELEASQLAVEHGSFPDAKAKLIVLNQELDRLSQ